MKTGILGATFNTGNMGVSMLAAGALRCVLHRFPHARLTMLDYARESREFAFPYEGRRVTVGFVNIRFSKKIFLPNNIAFLLLLTAFARLLPGRTFRRRLLSRNKSMREILETDIFFALSGGDSFSDIYGIGRFLYVTLPQLLVLLAGKRLICLPQTIGPFRHGVVRLIARYILSRAEAVYSRDHSGVPALRELLRTDDGDGKLRFCYDLSFDVDPVPPTNLDVRGLNAEAAPIVGVNVSGLLLAGGYTKDNMFGLTIDYRELVKSVIGLLIENKSANVLLIPHVFGSPGSVESDTAACETIFDALQSKYPGRIGVVQGRYRHDEIKHIIGRCEFFVGARMHACIAATSQTVPAVAIAYSDKFAGMMRAIGLEGLVVDPRKTRLQEMLRIVGDAYDNRLAIRSALQKTIPPVRETIRNSLRDIPAATETGSPLTRDLNPSCGSKAF